MYNIDFAEINHMQNLLFCALLSSSILTCYKLIYNAIMSISRDIQYHIKGDAVICFAQGTFNKEGEWKFYEI